jgi:2-desacetyl-2-hydroxyethyl bacteriochlorophyllide A dehydrogenase
MKACLWNGTDRLEIVDKPVPEPQPDECLIKTLASGVCGTDIHIMKGAFDCCRPPMILGHEACGEIVKTGSEVKDFEVGERVAVENVVGCGRCYFCKRRIPQYCLEYRELGFGIDGVWREYFVIPARCLYRVKAETNPEYAAMVEPLNCVLGALGKCFIEPGDDILILGAGPAGMFFLQAARLRGAGRIIITTTNPSRKEKALYLGADYVVNTKEENLTDAVKRATGGHGPAIAIDAIGLPETFKSCLDLVTPEGQVIAYGVGATKPLSNIFIDDIVLKMLTIHGDQSSHRYYDRAIKLIETGRIDAEAMITHRFPFEEVQKAVDLASDRVRGTVKVMLRF